MSKEMPLSAAMPPNRTLTSRTASRLRASDIGFLVCESTAKAAGPCPRGAKGHSVEWNELLAVELAHLLRVDAHDCGLTRYNVWPNSTNSESATHTSVMVPRTPARTGVNIF